MFLIFFFLISWWVFVFLAPLRFAWPPVPVFGPGPRFVFTGPGTQFVFTDPGFQFVFRVLAYNFIISPGPEFAYTNLFSSGLRFVLPVLHLPNYW